jgi:hypothetical protein
MPENEAAKQPESEVLQEAVAEVKSRTELLADTSTARVVMDVRSLIEAMRKGEISVAEARTAFQGHALILRACEAELKYSMLSRHRQRLPY